MNTTVAVYISNQRVAIFRNEISIKRNNDLRTTCDFVVQDPTGLIKYSRQQPVRVEDSARGTRFTGYIDKVSYSNIHPNPDTQISVSCVDENDLAMRSYAKRDYYDQDAGDIAADLHNNYLAGLGVTAAYAMRRDTSTTQFGLGTLSNVVGASNVDDGDLELTSAGSEVTVIETTTADFATGTLTNVSASNNALMLNSVQALQMVGTASQGANNNYSYFKIWSGSVSIAAGDKLVYTIWVSSSSPKITGGIDLVFTDGTAIRNMNIFDQNGLFAHPATDLSGYGNDVWYTRTIGLSPDANGKTTAYAMISQEGDDNGTYTFYVRDIKLTDSSGTLKGTIMSGGTPAQAPTQLSDIGYSGVTLKTVTAYMDSGNRVSPSRSISTAGIVRASIVSWSLALVDMYGNLTDIANDAQGSNDVDYCSVESSIDGGVTWQSISNHGAIANLYAGASASGLSVLLRETLRVAGPDPTVAPVLTDLTMTVEPSYSTVITNIQSKYNGSNWNTAGTHNNTATSGVGDLALGGYYRNWATDPNPYANISVWGTGNPTINVVQPNSCLQIRCDPQTDVRARFDDAGTWGDGTIECDVYLEDAVGDYGLIYRTTNWSNTRDSQAYTAAISSTSIFLGYGTNGGSSSFTHILTVPVTLQTDQWYHLKVQFSGTTHKVWLNDVLYINVTDATYTAAGYVGLRHYNSNATGGARHSGKFQNFGIIVNQTGSWVSTGVSLSSLGTFGSSLIQWNDDTPSNATLLIESSIDNGSTYQTCTNNAALPNATPGTSASGKTLKIRTSLSTQNANVTPKLHGLSVLLSSAYSASGSRISPALSLNSASTAGSASVQWNALVPTGTTLDVDTSPDGSTWTLAGGGASGSAAIPGIITQQDAIDDSFDTDTSASYTNTSGFGGNAGTWTWDLASSRLTVSGGAQAFLLYTGVSTADVDMWADVDISDESGFAWRVSGDQKSYYQLAINDNASINVPNTIALFKSVAGTRSQIAAYTGTLLRGKYYRYHAMMVGGLITVYLDGQSILTYTDGSPLAAGGAGLANDGGSARIYQFRVQSLGQSVVGQFLYTRARLTSTDPTATPQLEDLTLSVRSPDIITGALIPEAKYSVLNGATNTIFDDLSDLASQSNAVAAIDMQKALKFVDRRGTPAPWVVTTDDMHVMTDVTVATNGDKYRNKQILFGGTDTIAREEKVVGDGITQTWRTSYKIQSVSSISVNGTPASFGVQGVDSGKDFYYTPGEVGFSQDSSLTPLDDTQMPVIAYLGLSAATVILSEDDQISELALIDETDGVIEAAEDVSQQNLGIEAMLQLAESRLDQYAVISHSISFTTLRDGLLPNMVASVFHGAYHIQDAQYIVSSISENIDATNVEYDVAMTDGSDVYDYQHYLADR